MKRSEIEEDELNNMPQKKFYRSRAHCNPLSNNDSFDYPHTPELMNWKLHFPNIENPIVRHVDVGCGFGGLTISLSELFPDKCVVGFEIRAKVCEYVRLRILALRQENKISINNILTNNENNNNNNNNEINNNNNNNNTIYENATSLRTNCMRYLPNFFNKYQLEKIFFCFPDPHFKTKNHRRRIVNDTLLSEYAYFLKPGGKLYTVTDVKALHDWHIEKCSTHPCFIPIAIGSRINNITEVIINTENENDPCIEIMLEDTEESKKVRKMGGNKYYAVFQRLSEQEIYKKEPNWIEHI